MILKIMACIAMIFVLAGFTACSGEPSDARDPHSDATLADSSAPEPTASADETAYPESTTATSTSNSSESASKTDGQTNSAPVSESTSSHSSIKTEKVDSSKVDVLIFRKFVTPDAGQKSITNESEVKEILKYIEAASKSKTSYDNAPGTILSLHCADANYTATIYHGDILLYGGEYYKVSSEFRRELLTMYNESQAKAVSVN